LAAINGHQTADQLSDREWRFAIGCDLLVGWRVTLISFVQPTHDFANPLDQRALRVASRRNAAFRFAFVD